MKISGKLLLKFSSKISWHLGKIPLLLLYSQHRYYMYVLVFVNQPGLSDMIFLYMPTLDPSAETI